MMICSDGLPNFHVLTIGFSVCSRTGLANIITREDQMGMIFAGQMCLISGWNSVKLYVFNSVFSSIAVQCFLSFML